MTKCTCPTNAELEVNLRAMRERWQREAIADTVDAALTALSEAFDGATLPTDAVERLRCAWGALAAIRDKHSGGMPREYRGSVLDRLDAEKAAAGPVQTEVDVERFASSAIGHRCTCSTPAPGRVVVTVHLDEGARALERQLLDRTPAPCAVNVYVDGPRAPQSQAVAAAVEHFAKEIRGRYDNDAPASTTERERTLQRALLAERTGRRFRREITVDRDEDEP